MVQQLEKYIYCLNALGDKDPFFEKLSLRLSNKVIPQVVNPQGILLIGRSNEFNEQQKRDFELIKRQYKNVADIMTYDDLLSRLQNIIDALKKQIEILRFHWTFSQTCGIVGVTKEQEVTK